MRTILTLAAVAWVVAVLVVLTMARGEPASATHQAGLVAYWDFDDSADTSTALDAAHDNHGSITDATYDCADKAPVPGNACSLDFNGTSAVVEAANESNFDLTDLSISFWFKLQGDASTNDYPRPVSKGNSTTTDGGYSIWVKDVSDPTDIGMGLTDTGGTRHDARDSALPDYDDSGWHHVVGTYDSVADEGKLYVDGTLEATNTDVFTLRDVDNPFSIGAAVGTVTNPVASRFFNGLIDEVLIYNRALSADEIAALAACGCSAEFLPPITNDEFSLKDGTALPIHFRLLDVLGNVIAVDLSGDITVRVDWTGSSSGSTSLTPVFDATTYTYNAVFQAKGLNIGAGTVTVTVEVSGADVGIISVGVDTVVGTARGNGGKP